MLENRESFLDYNTNYTNSNKYNKEGNNEKILINKINKL